MPRPRLEHVRLALEELGPTFVKLGLVLSTRSICCRPEYLQELVKLQDAAPRSRQASPAARDRGESSGGSPRCSRRWTTRRSSRVDREAHAATLLDGADVVVKVRRTQVVEQIEDDLELLQDLPPAPRPLKRLRRRRVSASSASSRRPSAPRLDYLAEGRTAERFAGNFAGDDDVRIPHVYWGYDHLTRPHAAAPPRYQDQRSPQPSTRRASTGRNSPSLRPD